MRHTRIITTLMIIFMSVMASNGADFEYLQKIAEQGCIPESPQAAEFRRLSMPVPDLATGAASFSIDLYTFNAGEVNIPFTLKYAGGNGIHADDSSFPCGFGWQFLPALRITRQIMGRPDDIFPFVGDTIADFFYQRNNFRCKSDSGTWNNTKYHKNRYDPEYDIFTLHLPDRSATLLFCQGKFVSAGMSDYTFENDPGLDWIRVTDPSGIIYMFDVKGERLRADFHPCCEWLLSKIILPDKRVVNLSWRNAFYRSEEADTWNPTTFVLECGTRDPYQLTHVHNSATRVFPYENQKTISSISLGKESVKFDYEIDPGLMTANLLKRMSVQYDGQEIYRISFGYENLMLMSVDHYRDGKYSFDYHIKHIGGIIPQDYWGFRNVNESVGVLLVPGIDFVKTVYFPKFSPDVYKCAGANKEPDEDACQARILRCATYPTGASVSWDYELHQFPPVSVMDQDLSVEIIPKTLTKGGGVRVRRMVMRKYDGDPDSIVRTYTYGQGGTGLGHCDFAPTLDTYIDRIFCFVCDEPYVIGTRNDECYKRVELMYNINDKSNYRTYAWGSVPVWYDFVTETEQDGVTEHTFAVTTTHNSVKRKFSSVLPEKINRLFGAGSPKEVKRQTYMVEGTAKVPVETVEYTWQAASDNALPVLKSTAISRAWSQSVTVGKDNKGLTPDFDENGYVRAWNEIYATYEQKDLKIPIINAYVEYQLPNEREGYRVSQYTIEPLYDQLISKTVTRHLSNGDRKVREEYSYQTSTSLLVSTSTYVQNQLVSTVSVKYPSASGTAVERKMIAAGQKGVSLATWTVRGSAVDSTVCIYDDVLSGFCRPVAFYTTRRGASRPAVTGFGYSTDRGVLNRMIRPDGHEDILIFGSDRVQPTGIISGNSHLSPSLTDYLNYRAGDQGFDFDRRYSPYDIVSIDYETVKGISMIVCPDSSYKEYFYYPDGRLKYIYASDGTLDRYSYVINASTRRYYILHKQSLSDEAFIDISDVSHFDEYLRPTISARQIPGGYVATLTDYDRNGNPEREWAQVPVSSLYPTADQIRQSTHYGDTHPYTLSVYEPMTNELVRTTKAGRDWHVAGKSAVRNLRLCVSADEIRMYTLSADGKSVTMSSCRGTGAMCEEITDEDGRVTRVFTDRNNRKFRTSVGKTGQSLDTYYIYNDYGDLICVIPPMLSDKTSVRFDSEQFGQYGYRYEYDAWGRCTRKYLPGREYIDYRYDPAGRCVAMRDGNLRAASKWSVTLYDPMGREAVVALTKAADNTVASFASAVRFVSRDPGSTLCAGYKIFDGLRLSLSDVLNITFYDDYSWTDESSLKPVSADATLRSRGKCTGMITYCDDDPLTTVYHYNDCGQLAVTLEDTPKGLVREEVSYCNDRNQHTVLPHTVTTSLTGTAHKLVTKITYNSLGQETGRTYTTPAGGKATLTTGYNSVGQISKISFGGKGSYFDYAYDIHGWISRITTMAKGTTVAYEAKNMFEYNYLDKTNPAYSGNLSSCVRNRGLETTSYFYDQYNRLVAAKQTVPGGNTMENRYTYDRNTNITSISRYGVADKVSGTPLYGLVDSVAITYSGNQLRYVENGNGSRTNVIYESKTGTLLSVPSAAKTEYDSNGNLISDGYNGTAYEYNTMNQLCLGSINNGISRQQFAVSVDGRGQKRAAHYHSVVSGTALGGIASEKLIHLYSRYYVRCFEFLDNNVERIRFEGGFFDKDGKAWYYEKDHLGSVTGVIDETGAYLQQVQYYPYGEPTREPSEERWQFGGKERESFGGINLSDFGSRSYLASLGIWLQQDPRAEEYYQYSPYSFCFGNPLIFVDPDGEVPTHYEAALMCEVVYEKDRKDKRKKRKPGEKDLYDDDIAILGNHKWFISQDATSIQMNHPAGTKMGIQSMLFEREVDGVKEYAYVYAGTDCWEDAVEDITQLVGVSPQYSKAIENARALSAELGDKVLTFVGHSMGGGEAAVSSMATGREALTFNPAAVSPLTMIFHGLQDDSKITNYRVPLCGVSMLQDGLQMKMPGVIRSIPVIRDPYNSHRIRTIIEYLEKKEIK